jgi:hypothetical protein
VKLLKVTQVASLSQWFRISKLSRISLTKHFLYSSESVLHTGYVCMAVISLVYLQVTLYS